MDYHSVNALLVMGNVPSTGVSNVVDSSYWHVDHKIYIWNSCFEINCSYDKSHVDVAFPIPHIQKMCTRSCSIMLHNLDLFFSLSSRKIFI